MTEERYAGSLTQATLVLAFAPRFDPVSPSDAPQPFIKASRSGPHKPISI
jgi:hypothetical protein